MRVTADHAKQCSESTDAVLMSAVVRGDANAFRELTERYLVAVHRMAVRMLADPSEADEVTQDTFLKLWTNAGRWRPVEKAGHVLPWLRSIAMNACIDRLRRRRFSDEREIPDRADEAPSAADEIDRVRIGSLVGRSLGELPERQRAAIVLTYFEELSNAEAAATMDLHLKAFESLLLRSRQSLKALLANAGIGPADLREVA